MFDYGFGPTGPIGGFGGPGYGYGGPGYGPGYGPGAPPAPGYGPSQGSGYGQPVQQQQQHPDQVYRLFVLPANTFSFSKGPADTSGTSTTVGTDAVMELGRRR